jgi:hypothetical protein
MSKGVAQAQVWLGCAALSILMQACVRTSIRIPPTAPAPTESDIVSTLVASQQVGSPVLGRIRTATPPVASTATLSRVVVVAAKGNLFIRRGPNVAFNPISALLEGGSATASGRDVLGDWLEIQVPGSAERTGWISIQTDFTSVQGNVRSLPEIEPTDWPIPAYLRNCTYHQMSVDPGGIVLPSVDNFPDNDLRINPGSYTVRDTDVDAYPEVLRVDIKEGSAIDVQVDGTGEKKKCPAP